MIKKLSLKNFKCFQSLELDFSNVNILTGINGMGKSTVIQSILLAKQAITDNKLRKVSLNGSAVVLGFGKDILYEKAEEEIIEIILDNDNNQQLPLIMEYDADSSELYLKNKHKMDSYEWNTDCVIYLSAERISPAAYYGIGSEIYVREKKFGSDGNYTLQYLSMFASERLENDKVILGNKKENTLFEQVQYWMNYIAPGIVPNIRIDNNNGTADLRYEYVEGRDKTASYKSIHVGFGITYVLPVIIELLTAKEGDIVMIENPEAHIHPKGQRYLGELIARVGAGGIQVIVETHSDHILNGIRISVKNKMLEPKNLNLYFFYKDNDDGYKHKVKEPKVLLDGKITEWPEDFFDEWDNALLELL